MAVEATIYKSLGGFYTVKTTDGQLLECKPRGIFRKRGLRPVAGDNVVLEQEADTWFISEVAPRKNLFIRPPVANVDQVFVVASTIEPVPSTLVIDKLTVTAVDQEALPVVVITKSDLAAPEDLLAVYEKSGILTLVADAATGAGMDAIREQLAGKLSVFCGNSGVGKSTLLNALLPEAERETGEISQKLGRGRHTTREVEIFELAGGLLADTPGFASYDLQRASPITAENLQFCFPEIQPLITQCQFTGCSHLVEKGCAVRAAVDAGQIAPSRYNSYVALYREAKENEAY